MKKRIFIDMDGCLYEFNFGLKMPKDRHVLMQPRYFFDRPPQTNIMDFVRSMVMQRWEWIAHIPEDDVEIYILSAVYEDAKYALGDKHDALDRDIPCIDAKHRIFTICGEDKIASVPAFNPETDILIDDYGPNCRTWAEHGGTYIKVSRNAEDAEYEKTKHRYVIHPEMTPAEIAKIVLNAKCGILKDFHVEYREVYGSEYDVRAYNFEQAKEKLYDAIKEGLEDGPKYCVDTEYILLDETWLEGGEGDDQK